MSYAAQMNNAHRQLVHYQVRHYNHSCQVSQNRRSLCLDPELAHKPPTWPLQALAQEQIFEELLVSSTLLPHIHP